MGWGERQCKEYDKCWNQECGFNFKQTLYDFSSFHGILGSTPVAHRNILLAVSSLNAFLLGKRPVQSLAVCTQQVSTSGFPLSLFFLYLVKSWGFQDSVLSLFSFWILLLTFTPRPLLPATHTTDHCLELQLKSTANSVCPKEAVYFLPFY